MTFQDFIINEIDSKSRGQKAEADNPQFSAAEKSIDLRIMAARFSDHGLDERLGESKLAHANIGCAGCGGVLFSEETVGNKHIGCGGRVEPLPF
jgi:hypothetical protein